MSTFKRNVSYSETPEWQDVEHCHFFHSIDSNGQEQKHCAPVGGHFHEMILITPATETDPPVYKCSPPLRKVRRRNAYGQWEIVTAPANDIDSHTHEIHYKHSELWTPKHINPEFAKLQQAMHNKMPKSDSRFSEE